MRSFLYTILCIVCSVNTFAQVSIDDILKHSDKTGNRIESTSRLITESVNSELTIVRQQYRLERNGEHFGKNGKEYYGESYSLAIKVAGGTILSKEVIEPWMNDADYKRVNESNKYKPEYYWSLQRSLENSEYKPIEFELGTEYVTSMNEAKSLYLHADASSDFGLTIDDTEGSKSGYMIWAYTNTTLSDSSMVVSLRQSSFSVDARADSSLVEVAPNDTNTALGGLFVVPKYSSGGRVQFLLAGVAVKSDESNWNLQLLVKGESSPQKSEPALEDKKGKKKKKDSSNNDESEPTPIKKK